VPPYVVLSLDAVAAQRVAVVLAAHDKPVAETAAVAAAD